MHRPIRFPPLSSHVDPFELFGADEPISHRQHTFSNESHNQSLAARPFADAPLSTLISLLFPFLDKRAAGVTRTGTPSRSSGGASRLLVCYKRERNSGSREQT